MLRPNWRGWRGLAPRPAWAPAWRQPESRIARTLEGPLGAFLAEVETGPGMPGSTPVPAPDAYRFSITDLVPPELAIQQPLKPSSVQGQATRAARRVTRRVAATATTKPIGPTTLDVANAERQRRQEQAAADQAASAGLFGLGVSPGILLGVVGVVLGVMALRGGGRRGRR